MPKQHLPAAQQLAVDGVLTRGALRAAGLSTSVGDHVVRAGGGLRLAPSTYVLGTTAPSDAQLVAGARAHAGDDAVVTGLVACRLLGLADVLLDRRVDVLVPAARQRVSTPFVRVAPTLRPPRCWTHASGARVADPHRAVADAARRMTSLQDVRALVLEALRERWCGLDALRAEIDAGPRNGTALCRRALRDWEDGAWSAPEAEVADVARADPRLPRLLLNPTLRLRGTVVGQPDGWFLGRGLGWEVESRRFHADEERFDSTLARHDRFAGHGLQLLHVTPRRARRMGSAYAEVLAAAVAARCTTVQPEPAGLLVVPFDPRAHVVRDVCGPLPAWRVIGKSSGAVTRAVGA